MDKEPTGFQLQLVPMERKEEFRQVFQAYLHGLARYYNFQAVNGQYVYGYFDAYWQEPEARWLYGFFDNAGKFYGFAMVRLLEDGLHEMAEFGVVEGAKGQGIGGKMLDAILKRHTGGWRLEYASENVTAEKFWLKHFGHREVYKKDVTLETDGISKVELRVEKPLKGFEL